MSIQLIVGQSMTWNRNFCANAPAGPVLTRYKLL